MTDLVTGPLVTLIALAEHAAISRSPKAQGLSQVNTDAMSVGTR